jgi:SAM-dependent methyltransferase
MFNPPDYSAVKNFLNPKLGPWTFVLYMHRKKILDSLHKAIPYLKGDLLDVGCGNKPYRSLINATGYIGVDVDASGHNHSEFDFTFDGLHLPFPDNSFDSLICTEVIEHCQDPQILFAEMQRVLKKGGYAFITAPMLIEHHEVPHDHRRLTYWGMKHLGAANKFTPVWIDDRGSVFAVLVYSTYLVIGQMLSRRPFMDIILWISWPFAFLFLKCDGMRKKQPAVISLGWQMLMQK